jgi:hypothetical protein
MKREKALILATDKLNEMLFEGLDVQVRMADGKFVLSMVDEDCVTKIAEFPFDPPPPPPDAGTAIVWTPYDGVRRLGFFTGEVDMKSGRLEVSQDSSATSRRTFATENWVALREVEV